MNPMQPQQGPQPFKAEEDIIERKYEVQPNGDVKYTMFITRVSHWHANEFGALINENKKYKETSQKMYSEEHIAKLKEEEQKLSDEIAIMEPMLEEAQKLTAIEYKKMRHEGMLKNIRIAIDDKENGLGWFERVWIRTKPEIKDPVFKELNADEQSKVLKMIQKLKRKGVK